MHDSSWRDRDHFEGDFSDDLLGRLKAELPPVEYLLWADRPSLPAMRKLPFMPVLFVAVVTGLSGYALAAMFGIIQQPQIDPRLIVLALVLAPSVLACFIAADLVWRGIRWNVARLQL